MSTKVGTLQAPRAGRSIWPATFLVTVIMLTAALVAVTLNVDGPRTVPVGGASTEPSGGGAETTVSGTAANTPSEVRGGFVEAVDQPSRAVPHIPRQAAQVEGSASLGANTPSELTGGLTAMERYAQHQLI